MDRCSTFGHGTKTECVGRSKENCHSTNMDCAGCSKDNVHNAKADSIGNVQNDVYSINGIDIGNSDLRRTPRVRRQTQFYGHSSHANFALNNEHYALSAQRFAQSDPVSMQDAMNSNDWSQWKVAVNDEVLIKNQTWILCDLPPGCKAISSKWVFKKKLKANGDIEKYKARFVARGFSQEKGFDFTETYSPTAKLTTFRTLMSVANHFDYFVHQMDVKCAFLRQIKGVQIAKIFVRLETSLTHVE